MANRIETGNELEISFPVLILIGHPYPALTVQSRAITAHYHAACAADLVVLPEPRPVAAHRQLTHGGGGMGRGVRGTVVAAGRGLGGGVVPRVGLAGGGERGRPAGDRSCQF